MLSLRNEAGRAEGKPEKVGKKGERVEDGKEEKRRKKMERRERRKDAAGWWCNSGCVVM
jgi:hypothetical protein